MQQFSESHSLFKVAVDQKLIQFNVGGFLYCLHGSLLSVTDRKTHLLIGYCFSFVFDELQSHVIHWLWSMQIISSERFGNKHLASDLPTRAKQRIFP